MAAVDVTGLVVGISDYVVPVVTVGMAMLLLYAGLEAIKWVRIAMGAGGGSGVSYAEFEPNAETQVLMDRQAAQADPFAGVTYREATIDEQASWDRILEARECAEADAEMALNAQSAAMQDMAPGSQGSLFVTSGEGYGITFGTQGGSSYYDENDDFDMDPAALSDRQRRAM